MPVLASEIVYYGSAVMPEDDTTTGIGGAIATSVKPIFSDVTVNDRIEVLSSWASDTTQTVSFTGLNTVNSEVTVVSLTLTGTTAVLLTGDPQWSVIWKAVKSASTIGTITVRVKGDGATKMVFDKTPTEITTIRRIFYKMNSEVGTEINMEKVFVKNTNAATLSLSSTTIQELADATTLVTFAVAAAVDDILTNGAGNTRTTDGTGLTFHNTPDVVAVPGVGGNLGAGVACGIWLKCSLGAAQAATISTYQIRTQGNSA